MLIWHARIHKNRKKYFHNVIIMEVTTAYNFTRSNLFIDNANNFVFWCHFLNKLVPWHIVYIMQQ